jgi:DNA processing protein
MSYARQGLSMDWPLKKRKTDRPLGIRAGYSRIPYQRPTSATEISLRSLMDAIGKDQLPTRQLDLLRTAEYQKDIPIYFAGDLTLLNRPTVAIVGTREVSDQGRARTRRLARSLVDAGVTVMSGLARGVDREAHESAIAHGGKTVGVIGTPLSKAYPAENSDLQEEIYRGHLLLTPFAEGETVFKGNFPKRNRVMAALSDATVIMEASDTSGTLHQAAECQRLGRWLFISKAVAEDPALKWPAKFLGKPRTAVLSHTNDVLTAIR